MTHHTFNILRRLTTPAQYDRIIAECFAPDGARFADAVSALAHHWRSAHPAITRPAADPRADRALVHYRSTRDPAEWWIIRRDPPPNDAARAWGIADHGDGELETRTLFLDEILARGAELDLFFTPVPANDILTRFLA